MSGPLLSHVLKSPRPRKFGYTKPACSAKEHDNGGTQAHILNRVFQPGAPSCIQANNTLSYFISIDRKQVVEREIINWTIKTSHRSNIAHLKRKKHSTTVRRHNCGNVAWIFASLRDSYHTVLTHTIRKVLVLNFKVVRWHTERFTTMPPAERS